MSTVSVSPFLLNTVQKPARYIGGEYNSIVKDHRQMAVSVALAFPDVYEVAMSHLGLKILYEVINREEDVVAERVYAPWPDMEAAMRQNGLPLYTLETKTPVKEYDVFGFTLQYEMSCTNVLNMLDLAGLPIWSEERTDDMPLVIAGGPCVYNPEPLAPFIDVFFVGESEESIVELVDAVKAWKAAGRPDGRRGLLERMAQFRATMCPRFMMRITIAREISRGSCRIRRRRRRRCENAWWKMWTRCPCRYTRFCRILRPCMIAPCSNCFAAARAAVGFVRRG